jgi:sortase B
MVDKIKLVKEKFLPLCKKDSFRKMLLITDLVIILLSSSYFVIKTVEHHSNENLHKKTENLYKESAKEVENEDVDVLNKIYLRNNNSTTLRETKVSERFLGLLKANEDTVGWIKIDDTKINYPIVKSNSNEFYIDRNFEKKKSSAGSIFMDYRNNELSIDKNIIIYGHHMKDGTMFADLSSYKNKEFFYSNDKISFNTLYEEYECQVFSVYVADDKFNYLITEFESNKEYSNYINTVKSKSKFKKDISVTIEDKILTLSTCSYEFPEARTVVHAKLIRR